MGGCEIDEASERCIIMKDYFLKLLGMPSFVDGFDDYERNNYNNYLIPCTYKVTLKNNQTFLHILSTSLKQLFFQKYTPSSIYSLHEMKESEELLYKHKV